MRTAVPSLEAHAALWERECHWRFSCPGSFSGSPHWGPVFPVWLSYFLFHLWGLFHVSKRLSFYRQQNSLFLMRVSIRSNERTESHGHCLSQDSFRTVTVSPPAPHTPACCQCCPFVIHLLRNPYLWQPLPCSLFYDGFPECHINEITQYIDFTDWPKAAFL